MTSSAQALALIEAQNFPAALKLLRSISNPTASDLVNLGSVLNALNYSPAESLSCFQRAIALDPNHFEALANLAFSTNSVSDYLRALRVRPDWAEGHAALGSLYDDQRQEAQAIVCFERAVELSPGNTSSLFNLALVQAKAGSLPEAIAACKRLVRLDAKHGPGNALLAELLWRSGGQPKEAVHFAKRAAASTDAEAQLAGCLVAAMAAEQGDDPEEAVGFLRQACAFGAGRLAAQARLGSLLLRLGRESEAAEVWGAMDCGEDGLAKRLVGCMSGQPRSAPDAKSSSAPSSLVEVLILNTKLPCDVSHLTNKARLSRALHAAGHDDDVVPRSFVCKSLKEAELAVAKLGALVYCKDPAVQRGQGISLVRHASELARLKFGPGLVVQRAVEPLLLGGRKFGVRVHALCVVFASQPGCSVFVFDEGILTLCGLPYDRDSTDPRVHIASSAVQRASPDFDLAKVKGVASEMFHGFAASRPQMRAKVFACVKAAWEHGMRPDLVPASLTAWQVFGFDLLWDAEGQVWVCEANAAPQFQDAKKLPGLTKAFAVPMINELADVVCQGYGSRQEVRGGWKFVGDVVG